jgi:hypothetical protein
MNLIWLLLFAKLPPINSANDALLQLRSGRVEAIANVEAACRGRLRHALKDEPRVLAELVRLSSTGSSEVKKAALDAHRCFSAAKWVSIMKPRLEDSDPAIIAHAAEVSARVSDPIVVPPLLDRLEAQRSACLMNDLAATAVDVCVWLTYAPGASLAGAERTLRERAARAAAEMLDSPHPKVREVAVETLASAGIASWAKQIGELIAKEKKGAFARKNDAALLARFDQRRRTLSQKKE